MRYAVKSAPPPSGDRNEFVMSDGSVDRMGDVIEPGGWDLAHFRSNPVALFGHDQKNVIGRWENVKVVKGQLRGRLVFADKGTSPEIDKFRALHEQGILRAVSVGFRPLKQEKLDDKADENWGPFRFLKQELLECSLVAVPANAQALAVSKSLNLSREFTDRVFSEPASTARPSHGKPAKHLAPQGTTMTLSQKIQAAQKRIAGLRDQLTELVNKDDPTEDETRQGDELRELIDAEQKNLERLELWERTLAPRAGETPAAAASVPAVTTPEPGGGRIILPRKKLEPLDHAVRAMAVSLRAFGTQTALDQTLREMYGNDEGTQIVLRAAVNPAMTTTAGYAAELVNTAYGALMDRLMANSLYAPLASAGNRIDFGRNGQVKIPVRSSTPRASGAWVGEGAPKPVKKIGLSQITLTPHKLAVITTFTEEMAFYSTPAIEGILRKAMDDDTRESLDGYLIDNVAASASRPAGLLNGVTPITAASSGTTIEKIVADLNALIAPMEAAGGGGNVIIMMNPAQARKLGMAQTTTGDFAFATVSEAASKLGIRGFISSTTVPAGTLIAVDADWFATATGDTPRFAVSNEATLHEEDTNPLALGTAGTPNVVAAPMRSLFQTDSIAIRLSLYVTWSMTRSSMVQTIASVGW